MCIVWMYIVMSGEVAYCSVVFVTLVVGVSVFTIMCSELLILCHMLSSDPYFSLLFWSHPTFPPFFPKNPTLSYFYVLVSLVLFQNSVSYC